MSNVVDRTEELRAMLAEREDWDVWVIEFGITHFQMSSSNRAFRLVYGRIAQIEQR